MKYSWITIEEAAKRFSTPESVIRGVISNGKFTVKKILVKIEKPGIEQFLYRKSRSVERLKLSVREDQIKIWCESRSLHMRDKSISHVSGIENLKINPVKGVSLELAEDVHRKTKRMSKIYNAFRN